MHQWTLTTTHTYTNPFVDVTVHAYFTSPSGATSRIEAFHAGDSTWIVRWNPDEVGEWQWTSTSIPANGDFAQTGTFEVTPRDTPGFLESRPDMGWGFGFASGEPVFILGDTTYHLFGMAHDPGVGLDAVRAFMTRRRQQGFNLLRVRLPVSPFHPPNGHNVWQTRNLWPWGGSAQSPRFDQFNLDYFRTVDAVMAHAEAIGLGIELIMQGWGNEFPFNARNVFVAEWEDLWTRYLVARYDAYNATWFWQLHNEYEYYPDGVWHSSPFGIAERWASRLARRVRELGPHGHPIAIHNGPKLPPFAARFANDPGQIDTVMYQSWGTTSKETGWLAAGIEREIRESFDGWAGSAVFSEWGYEFNPDLLRMMLGHEWCDLDHTRRGAWRGAMCRLGIIHGFENSWGPFAILNEDQPGLAHLQHLHRFFTEIVDFAILGLVADIASGSTLNGHEPLTLANPDRSVVIVYLPTGGEMALPGGSGATRTQWFDPRTGDMSDAKAAENGRFVAPTVGNPERPDDWVLMVGAS